MYPWGSVFQSRTRHFTGTLKLAPVKGLSMRGESTHYQAMSNDILKHVITLQVQCFHEHTCPSENLEGLLGPISQLNEFSYVPETESLIYMGITDSNTARILQERKDYSSCPEFSQRLPLVGHRASICRFRICGQSNGHWCTRDRGHEGSQVL